MGEKEKILAYLKELEKPNSVLDDNIDYVIGSGTEKNLEKAKEKIPAETTVYADYDEFLDSGIEAVVLTNFFHEHAKYAIKCFKKNINVFIVGLNMSIQIIINHIVTFLII